MKNNSSTNSSSSSQPELTELGTTTQSLSRERLRVAAQALRDRGVRDVDDAVRLGAAVMVERCVAAFDEGEFRPGWLFEAVRQGGAWFGTEPRSDYRQVREERSLALREQLERVGLEL